MGTSNLSIFDANPANRSSLPSLLYAIQEREGFLSPEAIHRVANHTGLTDNQVFGYASFYPRLRFDSVPDQDPGTASLPSGFSIFPQDTEADLGKKATTAAEATHHNLPEKAQIRVATRNVGIVNPEAIADYVRLGGYSGLEKALAEAPEAAAAVAVQSGLREEDGIGISWDQQWKHCRQSREKPPYVIARAAGVPPFSLAESTLLENDPHTVLEGMLIAGYAAGASCGILYVDSCRTLALSRLESALGQMQKEGYLGTGIRGFDFNFKIQVVPALGPLPCGEIHGVIPALEGRRPDGCPGRPDAKIPMLQGRPALVHSVETLAKLPAILSKGADWYAGLGMGDFRGTQVVALAGCIQQPGLAEVPSGIPVRHIIEEIGGGIPEGFAVKAVQIGGPTGGWIAAEDLDIPLSRHIKATSGVRLDSGSIVVAATDACAVDLARQALLFASEASCGHCNFCREGTRQMAEILQDIILGRSIPGDLELLEDLSEGLKLGSACSLGRRAPDAFLTTVARFREEYETHVKEKRCLTGGCEKPVRDVAIPNPKGKTDRK